MIDSAYQGKTTRLPAIGALAATDPPTKEVFEKQ